MIRIILLSCLFTIPCFSQTNTGDAKSSGTCSPAVSGSNNRFFIECKGISEEQMQQFSDILNKITKDQLDPKIVMTKLDDLVRGVTVLREQEVIKHRELFDERERKRKIRSQISQFLNEASSIKQACRNVKEISELYKISDDWLLRVTNYLKTTDVSYFARFNSAHGPMYSIDAPTGDHARVWNNVNVQAQVLAEILKELHD
jgi:hypothetical protein